MKAILPSGENPAFYTRKKTCNFTRRQYTEQELLLGAQGKLKEDNVWDDEQVVAVGTQGLVANAVVVKVGGNNYLETVAQGDDVYEDGTQTHSQTHTEIHAGPNGIVETTTTGKVLAGLLDSDSSQLYAKFLVETDGANYGMIVNFAVKTLLATDARLGIKSFQMILRDICE